MLLAVFIDDGILLANKDINVNLNDHCIRSNL